MRWDGRQFTQYYFSLLHAIVCFDLYYISFRHLPDYVAYSYTFTTLIHFNTAGTTVFCIFPTFTSLYIPLFLHTAVNSPMNIAHSPSLHFSLAPILPSIDTKDPRSLSSFTFSNFSTPASFLPLLCGPWWYLRICHFLLEICSFSSPPIA